MLDSASGVSNTRLLTSDSIETCDRLKWLLQEKKARSFSNISNGYDIALAGKLLEYKCILTKQHSLILLFKTTIYKTFECLKLNEMYEVFWKILKRDFNRYSPAEKVQ